MAKAVNLDDRFSNSNDGQDGAYIYGNKSIDLPASCVEAV